MSVILYLAHSFPHTRGVKWVSSFREIGLDPIVLFGSSGKSVWGIDESLQAIHDPALSRKLDPLAHKTARRLAASLGDERQRVRVIVSRDVFLGRTADALSRLLNVPWYLDLCDNYPEVLRQQARGRRAWRRMGAPLIDAIERHAVTRAAGVVFVTPESREYVGRKLAAHYGEAARDSMLSRSLSVENAPSSGSPPPPRFTDAHDLVYIGTFDDSIRDLVTVVRGLAQYEAQYGRVVLVTLLTFDRARAERSLERSGVAWQRYVQFEDPVPASQLPDKLRLYVAGLVPHAASPAVDYTISNKIFDYLYAGTAVLASDNPPNVRLLREVGAGLCYERENHEHFATVLHDLILRRAAGDLEVRPSALFPKFTWNVQARPFLDVLQALADTLER